MNKIEIANAWIYNLMNFEFGEGQGKERAKVLIEALNFYIKSPEIKENLLKEIDKVANRKTHMWSKDMYCYDIAILEIKDTIEDYFEGLKNDKELE